MFAALVLGFLVGPQEARIPREERAGLEAPLTARRPAPAPSPVGILLWTAVIAALMLGAAWAARRWLQNGRQPGADMIRVLARRRLSPCLEILVVEVGDRCFVLGAGRDRIEPLAEIEPVAPGLPPVRRANAA